MSVEDQLAAFVDGLYGIHDDVAAIIIPEQMDRDIRDKWTRESRAVGCMLPINPGVLAYRGFYLEIGNVTKPQIRYRTVGLLV